MEDLFDQVEVRVLGCLIEKEMATPEYYPLSLNALVNACNQKSNRDPVVAYDETTVMLSVDSLIQKKCVWRSDSGRVAKYNENFVKVRNLLDKEAALICLLLLRGPQTVGELRGRTERLYRFNDLQEVEATLEALTEMDLVARLPRQPGRKECRYTHLLAGEPQIESMDAAATQDSSLSPPAQSGSERLAVLEQTVEGLRDELDTLRQEFSEFKKEFE
ncbi:MAG: YceH family protein [Desulfobulbaceae bacterium]|nr:YceH family protein [Desulfobulbaceae bacterium]